MSNLIRLNELTQELEKSLAENRAIQNYLSEIKTVKKTLDDARMIYVQSSEKLKEMHNEVNKLTQETSKVLKTIEESSDKNWSKLVNQNLEHIINLKKTTEDNLAELNAKIKSDFDAFLKSVEKEINEFNKSQHRFETELLGNIKKFQGELDQNLNTRLEAIDKSQKNFEKEMLDNIIRFRNEFDASLSSRLEKHSSDIQVAIRNEGTQIQRASDISIKENIQNLELRIRKIISALKWLVVIGLIVFSLLTIMGVYFLKYIKI